MASGPENVNLVIQAAMKLDNHSDRWHNVIAFVQSCYGCRVRTYDLAAAEEAMSQLSAEETSALITWVLQSDEARERHRKTA